MIRRRALTRSFTASVLLPLLAHTALGEPTSDPFIFEASATYCALTHPVEANWPVRQSTCEQQHVIPQRCDKSGGRQRDEEGIHDRNVVWWAASQHVKTDVWKGREWCQARPWFDFAFTVDDAAEDSEISYMLGTFGLHWSLFLHSYNDRPGEHAGSRFIPFRFDAASNVVYGWAWLANTPQKILNQIGYIAHEGHFHLLLDLGLFALVLFPAELILAVVATGLGLAGGLVLNPIDTVVALPSAVALLFETTFSAIWYYVLGLWRTVTSGWFGVPLALAGVPLSLAMPYLSVRVIFR